MAKVELRSGFDTAVQAFNKSQTFEIFLKRFSTFS